MLRYVRKLLLKMSFHLHPLRTRRLVALFFLWVAGAWIALVNGQPLFHVDSTAYVRGPDFAVVYFLGSKFATSWTQVRTLQGLEEREHHVKNDVSDSSEVGLNSPFDKAIISGRSIYYGALLYLSHVSSHLWLAVFAQAAIFVYLSYTLTFKCLRLSFFTFVCASSIALIASPLPFFTSLLMPDVFASFLIIGLAILFAFWDSLQLRDQIILFCIILYSALTHTSHLLLLIATASFFALGWLLIGRKAASFGSVRDRLVILAILCVSGLLGEFAFSYAVRHTIGVDPIRPPFAMARSIADGPGYRFLQNNCTNKTYAVCKYVDRLPVAAGTFLWSKNPAEGVFSVADLPTRTALSLEQTSFLIDVFKFDPAGVITSATKNFVRQLSRVGLDALFQNQESLQGLRGKTTD